MTHPLVVVAHVLEHVEEVVKEAVAIVVYPVKDHAMGVPVTAEDTPDATRAVAILARARVS